jgi:phytol kinase
MSQNDLTGMGLYFGLIIVVLIPLLLAKRFFNIPFEITRKSYHLGISLTIYPLVKGFENWYMAVLAVFLFALIVYPILMLLEKTSLFKKIAVEREGGEFKQSLLIFQASIALLLFVFWGLLGESWKYIAVAAVMAWGLGDASAALVGKAIGRHRIRHFLIEGTKTYEGTLAMYLMAGLAIFFTLLIYTDLSWYLSMAIALFVAPVCAAVEVFSNRGLDTITVPISTGLAVMTWMTFFSYLGV